MGKIKQGRGIGNVRMTDMGWGGKQASLIR